MKYPTLTLLSLSAFFFAAQPPSLQAQTSSLPQVQTLTAKNNLLPKEPSVKQPPAPVQLRMEKFFLSIQNKQVQEAYNTLMADSELESKDDQIRELITKTSNVLAEIGPLSSYELYDNRSAGSRMMCLIYFSYQAKKPLRWRVVFYAATPEQWRVINLSVDDLVAESLLGQDK